LRMALRWRQSRGFYLPEVADAVVLPHLILLFHPTFVWAPEDGSVVSQRFSEESELKRLGISVGFAGDGSK
jgi:hypothetical protein